MSGSPAAVVSDPSNDDIYVAEKGSNSISVISTSNDQPVATVQVGSSPDALTYDPSADDIVAVNEGSNSLSIISGSNNTVIAEIEVGISPDAIAYDSSNHDLFVADYGSNSISIVSDLAETVVANVQVGTSPDSIAYDPSTKPRAPATPNARGFRRRKGAQRADSFTHVPGIVKRLDRRPPLDHGCRPQGLTEIPDLRAGRRHHTGG